MVYAALAPVLAIIFFPKQDGISALLETYGTFAAGFLTRPFGALLFGYLGDHFGRRYALLLAVSLMSLPTFLIGCLPSYASVGLWAPCLLIGLRLLQGLAMSGEMPGCITFLSEMAPPRWQSLVASLAVVAALTGMLVGTNTVWCLQNYFGTTALNEFLWRTPFWAAGILGGIIYLLRRRLPESRAFLAQRQHCATPIGTCLRFHWRAISQGIGCYAANGVGFYFLMVFSLSYFNQLRHIPLPTALFFTMCLQVSMLLGLPLGGYLADRYGRRRIGLCSLVIMLLGTYPAIVFLGQLQPDQPYIAIKGLLAIAVVFACYSAILPSATATLFPTEVRYTGVALLNNTAMAVFGGLSPMLIAYLINQHHSLTLPAWPILGGTVISLLSFWYLPKRSLA